MTVCNLRLRNGKDGRRENEWIRERMLSAQNSGFGISRDRCLSKLEKSDRCSLKSTVRRKLNYCINLKLWLNKSPHVNSSETNTVTYINT